MKFNKNFHKIGYLRKSDKRVHIGRDVWLDESVFNGVMNSSKRPSLFVDRVLVAVFGVETLMTSTKSGKKSNRSKQKGIKSEKGEQIETVINQLDQTKMLACQDLYNHWLKNEYVLPEGVNLLEEMRNFDKYVSAKTAYYKKNTTEKKNKRKRKISEDSEKEEPEIVAVGKDKEEKKNDTKEISEDETMNISEKIDEDFINNILPNTSTNSLMFVDTGIIDGTLSPTLSDLSSVQSKCSDNNPLSDDNTD